MISALHVIFLAGWLCLLCGASAADEQCPPPPTGSAENRLLLAAKTQVNSLDPYALNDNVTLGLLGNVYEGLVKRVPTGELIAGLAERWELLEPTRWRLYLRQNVKFQKGQDFTADDVVFSAARVRDEKSDLKFILPRDAKVIKVDAHTVDVVLTAPNPSLMAEWDSWYIMSKPWIDVSEASAGIDPQNGLAAKMTNGTGPFSVTAYKAGARIQLTPNPNWWGGPHHQFDRVELCSKPDDGDRVDALLSLGPDRVDWIDALAPQDWQRVAQSSKAKAIRGEDLQVVFLGFDVGRDTLTEPNAGDPNPFKDKAVRQAIYQAIDIDAIESSIMRKFGITANSLVAPSLFNPIQTIKRWKYNVTAAKALLGSSSFPDGFDIGLDCPSDRFTNDGEICMAVKDMLGRIGIRVALNLMQRNKFDAKVLLGGGYKTSFYLFGWMPGSLDPLNVLVNLLACRDARTGRGIYNIGGYCNPTLETLIGQIQFETDIDKRNALILQAFQVIHQDLPVVPLHQQMALKGLSRALKSAERRDGRVVIDEFIRP